MKRFSMSRRGFVAGAAGFALAAPALAQQRPPMPADAPDPARLDPAEALAAWVDAFGRPTATVMINGRGPFKFLVDTGATTTVIANRHAAAMGLQPSGMMTVNGTTGTADVPLAIVGTLQCGAVKRSNLRVAMIERGALEVWDGMLGADMFAGRRLEFDIGRKSVRVENGEYRTLTNNRTAIVSGPGQTIRLRNGVLAELDGWIGRIRTKMILDTGADSSIGNPMLSNLLREKHKGIRRVPNATVVGVTGEVIVGEGVSLPRVSLGNVFSNDTGAILADAPIFRVWGLENEPAMLIGVDLLSRLQRFSIDYRTRLFNATPMAELLSQNGLALG